MAASHGPSFLREEAAQRLWNLWILGQRPDLNKFIAQAGSLTGNELLAILRVDQAQRWRCGERVPVESYLMRFPAAMPHALDLIYGECLIREELGERLSLEEYQQRFPQFSQSVTALGAPTVNYPVAEGAGSSLNTTREDTPLEKKPAENLEPDSIPGFEILGTVGQGGMGVVYKARQLDPDRVVALKVIRPEQLEQVNALKRFEREVRAARQLDHPNIVKFHDAAQVEGRHYFVMEFVSGTDLQKLVDQTGVLPPNRACDFVRQTALGLQHAYERGLVHRDIKPANVMVTTPGAASRGPSMTDSGTTDITRSTMVSRYVSHGAVVKILDMGLARVISAGEDQESWSTLTVAGTFMGTPDYMAPEQWENPHSTDIRADIYSLGCMLYFMLTGQVPFPGGSLIQKLDKHRSHLPTPVEQLRPNLPTKLLAALRKMMAKRPVDRYQTPGEAAVALESAVVSSGSSLYPVVRSQPPGEILQYPGHTGAVHCLAVAPDGKTIVTGGQDKTVRIWDAGTGKERFRLTGHSAAVRCVAFSPDGLHIVSGSDDRTARYWSATSGKALREGEHKDSVKAAAISPDGKYCLTGCGDRFVRLWDMVKGQRLIRYEGHSGDVSCVLFYPDSQHVLSCSWDKSARLWDMASGKHIRTFGGSFSSLQWLVILGMAISPDRRRLVVGGSDNLLRVWDPLDGRESRNYPGHTDWITAVAFSRDSRHVLTGSRDSTVRLWDLDAGRECHLFSGHTQAVTGIGFSPDSRFAYSAGSDGTVRCWRLPL